MLPPVKVKHDKKAGRIIIKSVPELFGLVFFSVGLAALCSLPFSEYHKDPSAYFGVLFIVGLAGYYIIIGFQAVTFERGKPIGIRKGFEKWTLPFEAVSGRYTVYEKRVSNQSHNVTYYFDLELEVDLPNNPKQWIRNGKANAFHYGFSNWGSLEQRIWDTVNAGLDDLGIPDLTEQNKASSK
jgi:hypothetical protein